MIARRASSWWCLLLLLAVCCCPAAEGRYSYLQTVISPAKCPIPLSLVRLSQDTRLLSCGTDSNEDSSLWKLRTLTTGIGVAAEPYVPILRNGCRPQLTADPKTGYSWVQCGNQLISYPPAGQNLPQPPNITITFDDLLWSCGLSVALNPRGTLSNLTLHTTCSSAPQCVLLTITGFESGNLTIAKTPVPRSCYKSGTRIATDGVGRFFVSCDNRYIVLENGVAKLLNIPQSVCPFGMADLQFDTHSLHLNHLYITCTNGPVVRVSAPSSDAPVFEVIIPESQCHDANSIRLDPATGVLYIMCFRSGFISYRTTATPAVTTLLQPGTCAGSASLIQWSAADNGFLFLSCADGLLHFRDGFWSQGVAISSCVVPTDLQLDPVTGDIFQSCVFGDDRSLVRLSGSQSTSMLAAYVCAQAVSIAIDQATRTAIVGCSNEGLLQVPLNATSAVPTTLAACPGKGVWLNMAFFDPASRTLYGICAKVGVLAYSLVSGLIGIYLPPSICPEPQSVYRSPHTSSLDYLYAACNTGLVRVDLATNTSTLIVPRSECAVYSIQGDPVHNLLFIACSGSWSLLDPVTLQRRIIANATLGCPSPTGLQVVDEWLYMICDWQTVVRRRIDDFTSQGEELPTECVQIVSLVVDPVTHVVTTNCPNYASASSGYAFQCYPGTQWVNGGCSECPTGTYRDRAAIVANQFACLPCPDGSVAITTGSQACSACEEGTYMIAPYISCRQCPDGTYSDAPGSTNCDWCVAGFYGSDFGQRTRECNGPCLAGYWCGEGSSKPNELPCGSRSVYCPSSSVSPRPVDMGMFSARPAVNGSVNTMTAQQPCPIGQFCDGSGVARPCTLGRYQNLTGQADCIDCPVGTRAPHLGSVQCQLCEPGTFTRDIGTITCSACSPGEFQALPGQTQCQECAPGRSAEAAGFQQCLECAPGRAASSWSAIQCSSCATGRYQPNNGSTECLACPTGHFAFDFTSTQCLPCAVGRYADQEGTSSCTPCSQGSASNATGLSTSCPLCQPGTVQSQSGATTCESCAAYTYSSDAGALTCSKCDTVTNADRSSCSVNHCSANTQFDQVTGECTPCALSQTSSPGGKCSTCPSNTYTPSVGSGCISCDHPGMDGLVCAGGWISVKEGYWAHQISATVPESPVAVTLYQASKCPEGFCAGAQLQLQWTNGTAPDPADIAAFVAPQCKFPRVNHDANVLCGSCAEGYVAWADSCDRCTEANGGLVFGYLVLSLVLVAFLCRSSADSSAGYSVVLVYFAQTAMLEIGPAKGWLSWVGIINFNGVNGGGSGCLAPFDAYEQTLMSLLMPVFLLCEMLVLALLHFALSRSRYGLTEAPAEAPLHRQLMYRLASDFSWSRYVGAAMSVLLFCYTQATATCISFLTCVDVGDARVVFSSPTMDCRSSAYHRFLVPVVIALVTYVLGFPLSVLAFLWRRRKSLADRASVASAFVARWGPLFQMYSLHSWYWQVTVLVRRAVFVVLSVALVDQAHARGLAFSLLNLASLLLQQHTRPFVEASINAAEVASHVLLIGISMVLSVYVASYSLATQVIFFLLVVPFICAATVLVLNQKTQHLQLRLGRVISRSRAPSATQPQDTADDSFHTVKPSVTVPRLANADCCQHTGVELTEVTASVPEDSGGSVVPVGLLVSPSVVLSDAWSGTQEAAL